MIPKETIDEIFQTARVEEVIGDFVQLKKTGSNYKGKSPFVDERTPSFIVSPAKQIWKCFSSGKGGNVISFLMEAEHFSYVESLRWLANKYNVEIKEARERTPEEVASYTTRENLSLINEFARDHFHTNLLTNPTGKAIGLSYFIERGFRQDIIEKFQLGYSLDESNGFTNAALEKNYKLEYLEKTGLTKVKDDRTFDFFRGRVMFPIHSIAGKVLGFGGRTLKSDKNVAKYFNSPESELYNKSAILYGLYFAKNAIIKYDNCFLVEGYTDVISMYQAGVENVVASSGTSLTSDQIKLIKRYTENITILYDGDSAGIKASFRGIDMILSEGMNVKVVLFPDGNDPDSFAKKSTTEELKEYIDSYAKDFIVFKSDVLLKDAGSDPNKKAQLINEIVDSVAVIEDAIKRQVYSKECASIFSIDEQLILQEVNKSRKKYLEGKEKQQRRENSSPPPPQGTTVKETVVSSEYQEYDIPIEAMIPPEYAEITQAIGTKENPLIPFEFDLIRILLSYGTYVVRTNHIETDDQDNDLEKEVELSVIELILHELEKDEIAFNHPVLKLIYNEFKEGLGQEVRTLYKSERFIHHQNQEIAKISADIISTKYEISPNWSVQKVRINTELDKLDRAVIESIYAFKQAKIICDLKEIQQKINDINELETPESINEIMLLLGEHQKLDAVKILLSDKLGRTII